MTEVDVLIEAGHPSRPDRHELMRQHDRDPDDHRRAVRWGLAGDLRGVRVALLAPASAVGGPGGTGAQAREEEGGTSGLVQGR